MGDATRARFIAGDPLRGLAALAIVVYHAAFFTLPYTLPPVALAEVFTRGYGGFAGPVLEGLEMGLYVFFALSGYLISRPFVGWLVRGGSRPRLRRYAANRALRIVPAFWLAISLALLLHGTDGASAIQIGGFYAFLQTYTGGEVVRYVGQGWTLGIEVAFYALVPLAAAALAPLAARLRGERGRAVLVLAAAAGLLLGSLWLRRRDGVTLRDQREIEAMLFAFAPGIALAALEHLVPDRLRGLRNPGRLAGALAAAGIGVLALRQASDASMLAVSGLLGAAGASLLVAAPLAFQWATGRCPRALDNPALQWLGERSYGLYVLHVLVGLELFSLADGHGSWAGFLIVLGPMAALSLLAAEASFRLVEAPFLRLKPGHRGGAAAAASAHG